MRSPSISQSPLNIQLCDGWADVHPMHFGLYMNVCRREKLFSELESDQAFSYPKNPLFHYACFWKQTLHIPFT